MNSKQLTALLALWEEGLSIRRVTCRFDLSRSPPVDGRQDDRRRPARARPASISRLNYRLRCRAWLGALILLLSAFAVAEPRNAPRNPWKTHQEPQQKPEAGDAEPQAPSAPEESKQKPEPSVFQQLARDPKTRRSGRPPGDGWIPVPGTNTEVRFGGLVQANFIHDFENTGFPFGDFIPSHIPVPTDDTPNTEFDPRTSRLTFESQTNVEEYGSVHAMVSMDFAGSAQQGSVQPRLRQAYVSWVGVKTKAAFTVGQSWSTFLDLGVWPDIFDLEGPNAMTGSRQGLVRGSYAFDDAKRLVGDLAVEQPESDVEGGTGLTSLPDLVARINRQRDWGHLQVAAIGRQLIAESTTGTGRDSDFGWGLSLSGRLNVPGTKRQSPLADERGSYLGWGPRQDNVRFQIQGGAGIGRYVFDLGGAGGQDAVYDAATAQLTPLEEVGAFGAYEHWWADRWRSTLVGGVVRIDNQATQPSTALKETIYAVANLVYRPFNRMDVGIEYYWGQRENKDGDTGDANRLMISVSYGF